ncbi:MAG: hypothetical protein ACT4PQ_12095 [Betaproteobacteria bacterium]
MKNENLVTALAAALTRIPARPAVKPEAAADLLLVTALRNSATGRDQIIQRRIGIYPEVTGAMS